MAGSINGQRQILASKHDRPHFIQTQVCFELSVSQILIDYAIITFEFSFDYFNILVF